MEVGRKLQAFQVGWFPELRYSCYRVGLTPDQVREYGLPDSPLKDKERRADRWMEQTGVKQTEIDALATLQPDLLAQIAREAISPFFDHTLADRVNAARRRWLAAAQAIIDERLGDDLRQRIQAIADELDGLDFDSGLPTAEIPKPRRNDAEKPRALISSAWDFAKQTQRLQAAKSYNNIPKHIAEKQAKARAMLQDSLATPVRQLR